jgi:transposase-like protein
VSRLPGGATLAERVNVSSLRLGKISRIRTRSQLDCASCRYRFSVTAGTILHDTHLPLWKWFVAVYLIVESNKLISATQLKRTIGVSYKTAWYLHRRIRAALREVDIRLFLMGVIEPNEPSAGDEMEGKERRYRGSKTVADTLIHTDERDDYRRISDRDAELEAVEHRDEGWVADDAHSNLIEDIWSLLKQSGLGGHDQIQAKHLDFYLDALKSRANDWENPYAFRDAMWKLLMASSLPYWKLAGE